MSEMLVVATQHTKQISIDDLVIGMYIVGLDQSWLQSPFLLHRRRIGRHEEIARLKAYGVRRVTIDPTRGLDLVETLSRPAEELLPSAPALAPLPPQDSTGGEARERDNVCHSPLSRPRVAPLPGL